VIQPVAVVLFPWFEQHTFVRIRNTEASFSSLVLAQFAFTTIPAFWHTACCVLGNQCGASFKGPS